MFSFKRILFEDGHIDRKWIVFHPHSYGIATLMRIGIKLPSGRQILLHHFSPHQEIEFHDHPWDFTTLVLWGGYVDESLRAAKWMGSNKSIDVIKRDILGPGHFRRRQSTHAHRTCTTSKHTWTIVVTSPKKRTWCKGTPESWVCGGKITDFDATRGMVKIEDA